MAHHHLRSTPGALKPPEAVVVCCQWICFSKTAKVALRGEGGNFLLWGLLMLTKWHHEETTCRNIKVTSDSQDVKAFILILTNRNTFGNSNRPKTVEVKSDFIKWLSGKNGAKFLHETNNCKTQVSSNRKFFTHPNYETFSKLKWANVTLVFITIMSLVLGSKPNENSRHQWREKMKF